jgi:hypothetical protein
MALRNFAVVIACNLVFVPLAMSGLATPLLADRSEALRSESILL